MLVTHAHPCSGRPWPVPPPPDALACSLTLPAEPHCAAVARAAVHSALHAHALDALAPAAVQVAGELIVSACLLAPGQDLYLSLRHREGTLRLTTYDNAPRPTHPRLAEACDTRRDHTLQLLAEIVNACHGDWGHAPAHALTTGTRTWAHLPHAGAANW